MKYVFIRLRGGICLHYASWYMIARPFCCLLQKSRVQRGFPDRTGPSWRSRRGEHERARTEDDHCAGGRDVDGDGGGVDVLTVR